VKGQVERVLATLEKAGVRYLVVGGVALVLHGYLRTTIDLDLVLQLNPDNLERALSAFSELGFVPQAPVPLRSFADPQTRETWAQEMHMVVFSLWQPDHLGFAVDLFLHEPFDFEAAYRGALKVQLQGVEATVLSREGLVEMKRATGRPRDLEDIEILSEEPS
jgi:hypothetical protein